jgi:hypothetical protein
VLTDSERDRATRVLRERYANGALTFADLDAQLGAVFSAENQDELQRVLHEQDEVLPARVVGSDVGESDIAQLEEKLAAGERVYWIGHPHPRAQLAAPDLIFLPLATVWVLIAAIGTFAVPWPFTLPLALFLAGGLQFLLGRFLLPSRRRRRTVYAVTDRRVISVVRRKWVRDRVTQMYLSAIPRVVTHQRASSSRGTIRFGDAPRYDELRLMEGVLTPHDDRPLTGVGFYNVEDPNTIKQIVEAAREHHQ